jgi:hypothetical protein
MIKKEGVLNIFNRIFICIMLLSILFSFNQCRKNEGKLLGTFSFTQDELNVIPYDGGETIVLVDTTGDSIKYIVQSTRKDEYIIVYRPGYADVDNIKTVDYYKIEKNSVNADDKFEIYLTYSSPFNPPSMKYLCFRNVRIGIHPEINPFGGYCEFNANKIIHTGQNGTHSDTYGINLYVKSYDTLKLNDKYFYSVYELSESPLSKDTIDYISTVYYSMTQGIVGIKTNNNRIWSLN